MGLTLFLANGSIVFAFSNYRDFMALKADLQLEPARLPTTVAEGLSLVPRQALESEGEKPGLMLRIAGGGQAFQQPVIPAPR